MPLASPDLSILNLSDQELEILADKRKVRVEQLVDFIKQNPTQVIEKRKGLAGFIDSLGSQLWLQSEQPDETFILKGTSEENEWIEVTVRDFDKSGHSRKDEMQIAIVFYSASPEGIIDLTGIADIGLEGKAYCELYFDNERSRIVDNSMLYGGRPGMQAVLNGQRGKDADPRLLNYLNGSIRQMDATYDLLLDKAFSLFEIS